MKKSFIVICVVLLFKSIAAQSDMSVDTLACNSPEAHLFDFWIGDWDIQQKIIRKDGTWLELKAQTSVAPILNGCALEEHWSGNVEFFWDGMQSVKYMEGFSIRYYDHRKGKWNIRWLDNNNLFMGSGSEGNFNNGKGEFFFRKYNSKRKTDIENYFF